MPSRLAGAFTLGGGTYPIKGFIYFLAHRFLWPLLKGRLFPAFLLSLFVLTNLFIWTYLPQVGLLAIFQGTKGAWFNGTILVLGEGAAIVALLFEAFFVDETQVDIFDTVLVAKGHEDLIKTSRPVLAAEVNEEGMPPFGATEHGEARVRLNPRQRLGKPMHSAIYGPFSLRQIIEFIVLLPLNLIPWAGPILFVFLAGYRAGPLLHWRYFKLKGFNRKQRNEFTKKRKWMYTWFGTVHLLLQLIPPISMLFLLTTAAGSALWAADLEDEEKRQGAASGEQYTDDPV